MHITIEFIRYKSDFLACINLGLFAYTAVNLDSRDPKVPTFSIITSAETSF